MLPGMVEIDDLDGTRKVLIGDVPDPFSAVGDDHFLLCPAPAKHPGFDINAAAEFIGILDRSRIGCGSLIAQWPALFIGSHFHEYAAHLDFTRARWLSFDPSVTAFQFRAHHGYLRAVHFDIKNRHSDAYNLLQFHYHY